MRKYAVDNFFTCLKCEKIVENMGLIIYLHVQNMTKYVVDNFFTCLECEKIVENMWLFIYLHV